MFYQIKNNQLLLNVRIKTNARQQKILGVQAERLYIGINCPPLDGKANAALCAFLCEAFNIPKSSIKISKGLSSKDKQLVLPIALMNSVGWQKLLS